MIIISADIIIIEIVVIIIILTATIAFEPARRLSSISLRKNGLCCSGVIIILIFIDMSSVNIAIAKVFLHHSPIAKFGLEKLSGAAPAHIPIDFLLLVLVIVKVQTRLHQLVHLVLISSLIVKSTSIVVFSSEIWIVDWSIPFIIIIVKHAFKSTLLLLLFELVLTAEIARA